MKLTEKRLQSAIIEALNYSGLCYVWNINSGSIETKGGYRVQLARAGTSDIIGLTRTGRFIALEVKLPNRLRTVTDKQQAFLDQIANMNGITGVVTDPNMALEIVRKGI